MKTRLIVTPIPEEEPVMAYLETLGVRRGEYFCFQDRGVERDSTSSQWSIERYRSTPVASLYEAVEELASKNVPAIRMGAASGGCWKGPKIIDYAGEYRKDFEEFADIVLMAFCKFFVGPGSGLQLCANSFNRPVCLINAFPWPWLENPMRSDSIVVPKKFWSQHLGKNVALRCVSDWEGKFHWKEMYNPGFLETLGVRVIENSSEEISGAVIEINDRLDGNWDGDDYLVKDYLSECNVGRFSEAKIATRFVEKNADLFVT